jgi:signal transduction histidine kinase
MQLTQSLCEAPVSIKEDSTVHMARLAEIGKAVSYVSHEMRNSLQRIMLGIAELRLDLNDSGEVQKAVDDIDRDVAVMSSIVKDLLSYSKPLNLEYSLHPISEVVKTALSQLMHRLRSIAVHAEFEDEERKIRMDHDAMVQVFLNLISNAADAMPGGGELIITASYHWHEGAEMLKVAITDSGCGIDEADLMVIQEPFVTTKAQGVGLGIPLCKNIILAHIGRFEIRSTVRIGTTVETTLPAQAH